MKKNVLLSILVVFAFAFSQAQTSKGSILIEANTGNAMLGSTNLSFSSSDGSSSFNIGLDGGYFIMDDLALKVGLGIGNLKPDGGDGISTTSYRIGAKYYLNSMIPITVDLTGASGDGVEIAGETPLWLGLGAGYAWFLTDHISIEPGLRYNMSMNEDYSDKGVFQFNVGFALYF